MDTFNKTLSFILGLVVVVVFIVVATRGFSQKGTLPFFNMGKTKVRSVTKIPTPTLVVTNKTNQQTNKNLPAQNQTRQQPIKIPKTGPGLLLPVLLPGLIFGFYLRKLK